MFIKTCDTLDKILGLVDMAKKFRKDSDGKDENSAVLVIGDFFSYENLVHKRLT
jgi:hypothetical protein